MFDAHTFTVIGHVIGTAIGVGGATVTDTIFLRALKEGNLTKEKIETLKTISTLIWIGLTILILSGLVLLILLHLRLPHLPYIPSEKMWAKLLVVAILFVNGLVFKERVMPLLEKWAGKGDFKAQVKSRSKLLFTTGSISIVSWYTALILGVLGKSDYTFWMIFSVYIAVLFVAIISSQFIAQKVLK